MRFLHMSFLSWFVIFTYSVCHLTTQSMSHQRFYAFTQDIPNSSTIFKAIQWLIYATGYVAACWVTNVVTETSRFALAFSLIISLTYTSTDWLGYSPKVYQINQWYKHLPTYSQNNRFSHLLIFLLLYLPKHSPVLALKLLFFHSQHWAFIYLRY